MASHDEAQTFDLPPGVPVPRCSRRGPQHEGEAIPELHPLARITAPNLRYPSGQLLIVKRRQTVIMGTRLFMHRTTPPFASRVTPDTHRITRPCPPRGAQRGQHRASVGRPTTRCSSGSDRRMRGDASPAVRLGGLEREPARGHLAPFRGLKWLDGEPAPDYLPATRGYLSHKSRCKLIAGPWSQPPQRWPQPPQSPQP